MFLQKNNKGFTLIELLVVVSIIGLLSTMAVVSLNNSRKKARDAKRMSDVKQLSNLIDTKVANSNGDYTDVFGAGCGVVDGTASTTCMGVFEETNTANIIDPSAQPADAVCQNTTAAPCNYAVASSSDTYYEICFSLEDGAGGLGAGSHSVSNGGMIDANGTGVCSN